MDVKFEMNDKTTLNGVVLLLGISYPPRDDDPVGAPRKVFTYAALKAGGLWYLTGSGRAPVAAGWRAVELWLERDGRKIEWVEAMGEPSRIWPRHIYASSDDVSPGSAPMACGCSSD